MSVPPKLQELRDAIDAIDVKLIDLLRERAGIVEQVRGVKGKLPIYIRPGREADMMRVIMRLPMGHIPKGLIHRLWREMIGGFTLQEGTLRAVVADVSGEEGLWDLARDHFGVLTPLQLVPSAKDALYAVRDKKAEVACVPMPHVGENWWRALLTPNMSDLKVFYRFPFDGEKGNARRTRGDGLTIADLQPEKTEADRTVLIVEWNDADSVGAMLADLPFKVMSHVMALGNTPCSWVEMEGFHLEEAAYANWREKYSAALLHHRIAGAYPVPMTIVKP